MEIRYRYHDGGSENNYYCGTCSGDWCGIDGNKPEDCRMVIYTCEEEEELHTLRQRCVALEKENTTLVEKVGDLQYKLDTVVPFVPNAILADLRIKKPVSEKEGVSWVKKSGEVI